MNIMEAILKRRSVRKYTGQPIGEENLHAILQAGLLAPTSRNLRPWEFFVVKDRELLKALSRAKSGGGAMLADCDVAIAVFADSDKADTWIEDASIAMTCISLMATDRGVGSCWCQIHLRSDADGNCAEENVRRILGVQGKNMRIAGILALGMVSEILPQHSPEDADWSKVHRL